MRCSKGKSDCFREYPCDHSLTLFGHLREQRDRSVFFRLSLGKWIDESDFPGSRNQASSHRIQTIRCTETSPRVVSQTYRRSPGVIASIPGEEFVVSLKTACFIIWGDAA